jgi:hypothetical protein
VKAKDLIGVLMCQSTPCRYPFDEKGFLKSVENDETPCEDKPTNVDENGAIEEGKAGGDMWPPKGLIGLPYDGVEGRVQMRCLLDVALAGLRQSTTSKETSSKIASSFTNPLSGLSRVDSLMN